MDEFGAGRGRGYPEFMTNSTFMAGGGIESCLWSSPWMSNDAPVSVICYETRWTSMIALWVGRGSYDEGDRQGDVCIEVSVDID